MTHVSNKVKRFLAMLLSVVMVFSSIPSAEILAAGNAVADDAAVTSIEVCGQVVGKGEVKIAGGTVSFNATTNTLTLSGNFVDDTVDNSLIKIVAAEDDIITIDGTATLTGKLAKYGINSKGSIVIAGNIVVSASQNAVYVPEGNVSVNGVLVAANGGVSANDLNDHYDTIVAGGEVRITGLAVVANKYVSYNGTGNLSAIYAAKGIVVDVDSEEDGLGVVTGAVSDNIVMFETNKITLGERVQVVEPEGGKISENRIVVDADGNQVNKAAISYVPETFTVSFNMSGKDATNIPDPQIVKKGAFATKPETDPKAEGYIFAGWCEDAELTKEFAFETKAISENTTVYAKWADVSANYTVTFDMNGKDATNVPEPQTVSANGYATKPATDPVAEGFVFTGWFVDKDAKEAFAFETTKISENRVIYAGWEDGDFDDSKLVDKYPVTWNLFESADEHVFAVAGVSANKAENKNAKSAAFYTATLEGNEIKVALKAGVNRKNAAKAANTTLEFDLGDNGVVKFTIPVQYVKPSFKLAVTSAPIAGGEVKTTVTKKASSGIFEPYDLKDAKVTFSKAGTVSVNNADVIIKNTSAGKGKISIKKDGWDKEVSVKFTVKKPTDVFVDLGGLKTVVVNKNASEQVQEFPLVAAGQVTIKDKKKSGLITISDNSIKVAYKSGVKKGTYKIQLVVGKSKQTIKVKVSEKALANGIALKVKGKYDIVTKQSMVLVPNFKEVGGKIVSANATGNYVATVNKAGNVVVDYTGAELTKTKMSDISLQLTVEGIKDPVSVTVKKVKAKKTSPKVKVVAVTVPNGASASANTATANIVSTYKDSAKILHTITPVNVTATAKKCTATVDEAYKTVKDMVPQVHISAVTAKKGTVKVEVKFNGGVTKKATIKAAKAK